jgi:hypothetical protein
MEAAATDKPAGRRSKAVATTTPPDTSMAAMIAKVAAQPVVDVKALHELLTLQERVEANAALRAYTVAFNEAQKGMEAVARDAGNKDTHSRYATHTALDKVMRPIYTAHGFTISFNTGAGDGSPIPDECLRVLMKLAHVGGHVEHYQIDMPADGKGAKGGAVMSRTHATGSAFSYGKRYLQGGAFNIVFYGEDDDGNKAGKTLPASIAPDMDEPLNEDELTELRAIAAGVFADPVLFCEYVSVQWGYPIAAFKDIKRGHFAQAKRKLLAKTKVQA